MTDNEIIKALKCCQYGWCNECPYFSLSNNNCVDSSTGDVLDLINRLQAENERLRNECGNQSTLWSKHFESIFETAKETIKAEAYKEFAERLKAKSTKTACMHINFLLKELVGVEND